MQSEKEFLTEVANLLAAIRHTPDERRKDHMRNHLHGQVYPKKYLYGFPTTEAVKKSIEYMKAGYPDPTREERFQSLKRTIERLTKVAGDMERERNKDKEQKEEKTPSSTMFLLKLTRLEVEKDADQDRELSPEDHEPDDDLERD